MWKGYENSLYLYAQSICEEWKRRGYKNTLCALHLAQLHQRCSGKIVYPPWMGNSQFHSSHRSNLLRKNYSWYSQFGWTESDNLPYVWPVEGVL